MTTTAMLAHFTFFVVHTAFVLMPVEIAT